MDVRQGDARQGRSGDDSAGVVQKLASRGGLLFTVHGFALWGKKSANPTHDRNVTSWPSQRSLQAFMADSSAIVPTRLGSPGEFATWQADTRNGTPTYGTAQRPFPTALENHYVARPAGTVYAGNRFSCRPPEFFPERHPAMTKQLLALTLATIALASAANAAEDSRNRPLADGLPPLPSVSDSAFSMRASAPGETHVVAPADAFPCRLAAAGNRDVLQLSIGCVDSLRCDSLYSPSHDEAITFKADHVALTRQGDGFRLITRGPLGVLEHFNFMKVTRGLPYFRPLDKSAFARAPAGWCSWYVFWQGIREDQMTQNTDWLAANLKQFGCEYVQIDDGWQGVGQGDGVNRDWYVTEKNKFPHGMKWLADYIRAKGLRPGIWLIPFATSDEKTFRERPELFVRRPDGSSVYETPNATTGKLDVDWTGRYVIDPTSPKARAWFQDLFHMICDDWGYDYVKIDGQGGSIGACQRFRERLADPKVSPNDAYRSGLATIKSVMGPKRFLLNCGGQYASCGYCEGIRTGGDVGGADWMGMQTAIQATTEHLYANHSGFWTDPDVVCVRPPLTLDQARAWATMVGITGQLLMTSDDMPKLGEDRVEILRRLFPVADIRPMELYPLGGKPRIFDLRVATPQAGQWDVVALFNWDTHGMASLRLEPRELGWPAGSYVYYDVWEKKLLGAGKGGLTLGLPPTSCKLVAARPMTDHPQLVGTSRHITQGADDLVEARWDEAAGRWIGRSNVVGGDPYQLRFTLPPGWTCADTGVKVEGPLAVLTLRREKNQTVAWQCGFRRQAAAQTKAAGSPLLAQGGRPRRHDRLARPGGNRLSRLSQRRVADPNQPDQPDGSRAAARHVEVRGLRRSIGRGARRPACRSGSSSVRRCRGSRPPMPGSMS